MCYFTQRQNQAPDWIGELLLCIAYERFSVMACK